MKYLIYLYTSILVLLAEIKDVRAEGGYVFKRLRLIKMESNFVQSIWGCWVQLGSFDNVGKRVLEEVNRDILAGFLAKSVEDG